MARDYYDILGISRNAPKDEVKKAFRKLAHKHHPDKGGSEAKFKELNEAYQVLSDEKKRAEYDRYGRVFDGFSATSGRGMGWDFSDFGSFADLGDIFEDIFSAQSAPGGSGWDEVFGFPAGGGRGGGRRVKRGRDISIDVELSFEEAVFGTKRGVLISRISFCPTCRGSGAKPGEKLKKCSACGGSGRVREAREMFFGSFSTVKDCKVCDGRGEIAEKKCESCQGAGVLPKSEEVQISIPAGIRDGELIKLSGQGEAAAGGVAGDLYVRVHVEPHPVFRREGNDLFMDLEIPLSEAVLGSERMVDTFDGKLKMKIPAGIDSGELLRLRGKGVPLVSAAGRGDLLIRVLVKIPKRLSAKARKLVEELKKEGI